MADLYKSINDYDCARGIFNKCSGAQVEIKKALEMEANGDIKGALNIYQGLYDNKPEDGSISQAEFDFWDDSILKCHDTLTNWDLLEKTILSRISKEKELWDFDYNTNHYLPYFIKSKVKMSIERGTTDSDLLSFFSEAQKEELKKKHIWDNYVEYLSLVHILQKDYQQALFSLDISFEQFIKKWASLNIFAPALSQSKLHSLQMLIEMKEFLDIVAKEEDSDCYSKVKILLDNWKERNPSNLDSSNIWDDLITNRHLYLTNLQDKFKQSESALGQTLSRESILSHHFNNKLSFLASMIEQDNEFLANKILHSLNNISLEKIYKIDKKHAYFQAKCHFWKSSTNMNIDKLWKAWETIYDMNKDIEQNVPKIQLLHQYKYMAQMLQLLHRNFDFLAEDKRNILSFHVSCTLNNNEGLKSTLLKESFNCLAKVIAQHQALPNSAIPLSDSYIELAEFCNESLKSREEGDSDGGYGDSKLALTLVECVLVAMKLGSSKAVQLFPRLLQILELYPDSRETFSQLAQDVAIWMFLPWISQMMAILDREESLALHGILDRIIQEYPMALVYQFKLSSEGYTFPFGKKGEILKSYSLKIKEKLAHFPIVDDFIQALGHLGVPHLDFKEYINDIITLKHSKADPKEILSVFQILASKLFFDPREVSDEVGRGQIYENFSRKFSKDVFKNFGKDGEKLLKMKNDEIMKLSLELHNKMLIEATREIGKKKILKLGSLSKWLSSYHLKKHNLPLEIPGQYSGKQKPLPQYHITITGFNEEVMVLHSKAQPRRVSIRGSDLHNHNFLVKSGEDLRQDSRIQQLFCLMNEILVQDAPSYHIHTYKVIPLTSRLGMIEWVEKTMVLNQLFVQGYFNNVHENYERWIKKWNPRSKVADFDSAFLHAKREEVVSHYQSLVSTLSPHLLRAALKQLCQSPEAWFAIRQAWLASHGTLSAAHWILGIGDRHLGNSLIKMDTGTELGIDFGYAFGIATQMLQVPEMIPFRLTPQIIGVGDPLGEQGPFQVALTKTLQALRHRRDLLLNLLDVFVKEPTLDWKKNALKQAIRKGEVQKEEAPKTYAHNILRLAKLKLEGANPSFITSEELKLGHAHKGLVHEAFQKVCRGDPQFNVRTTLPPKGLTVSQQVQCLIDQATDPYILGLAWSGWSPWQ